MEIIDLLIILQILCIILLVRKKISVGNTDVCNKCGGEIHSNLLSRSRGGRGRGERVYGTSSKHIEIGMGQGKRTISTGRGNGTSSKQSVISDFYNDEVLAISNDEIVLYDLKSYIQNIQCLVASRLATAQTIINSGYIGIKGVTGINGDDAQGTNKGPPGDQGANASNAPRGNNVRCKVGTNTVNRYKRLLCTCSGGGKAGISKTNCSRSGSYTSC